MIPDNSDSPSMKWGSIFPPSPMLKVSEFLKNSCCEVNFKLRQSNKNWITIFPWKIDVNVASRLQCLKDTLPKGDCGDLKKT